MSLKDSLLEERRGYVARGLEDRVAQVDAAIAALPDDEPPAEVAEDGGVVLDPNSALPAEPVDEVEPVEVPEKDVDDVETADEAKPSRSRRKPNED